MGNNLTKRGKKVLEIRGQKRAAALRENLKRRKAQNEDNATESKNDEKPENCE